jgi:tripartite-type tricarboxylate transporter receptor subunit TctC
MCLATGALAWISVVLTLALAQPAEGQVFPNKPIKLITGGVPGSVTDRIARPLAEKLADLLQQSVIVDNRPGAGGILAMDLVAKAAPDGYTLGIASTSQLIFNTYLFAKLPYDPAHDLRPVINIVSGGVALVAHPSFPANTLPELVALAKSNPGAIQYAIPQLGSPPHVIALSLQHVAGIDLAAVPYRSALDALSSVLNGDVPLLFDAPPLVAEHVKAGKLKALLVSSRKRSALLPSTPTLAESGFASVRGEAWIGLVGPARTAEAVIMLLNERVAEALRTPALTQYYQVAGWRVVGGSVEEFAATIRDDHATWSKFIRDAGIKLE